MRTGSTGKMPRRDGGRASYNGSARRGKPGKRATKAGQFALAADPRSRRGPRRTPRQGARAPADLPCSPASSSASAARATRQAPMPRAEPFIVWASIADRRPGAAVRMRAISRIDWRSNSCSTSRSRLRSPSVVRARWTRSIGRSSGASEGAVLDRCAQAFELHGAVPCSRPRMAVG